MTYTAQVEFSTGYPETSEFDTFTKADRFVRVRMTRREAIKGTIVTLNRDGSIKCTESWSK